MSAQPNLISEPNDGAGVHVLVIGVSAYRHLPGGLEPTEKGERSRLGQLNGPAKSASNFAGWMLNNHFHPTLNSNSLKSLRVLISPAVGEDINEDVQQKLNVSVHTFEPDSTTVRATIAAFQSDCADDRDSMAVVYICGHGVQVISDGAKLLLTDYGSPNNARLLDASVDLNQFYDGLYGHKFPQTQLWFYDCCAQKPAEAKQFETMQGGIGLDPEPGFSDVSPIYMAASEGTSALGKPNENSFFCQSVLWALEHYGAARNKSPEYQAEAENDYIVTTSTLNHNLKFILNKVASLNGGSTQFYRSAGRPNPAIFHEYKDTIKLPTRFAVSPSDFIHRDREIRDPKSQVLDLPNENWPVEMNLDVGLYIITIEPAVGQNSFVVAKEVEPSSSVTDVKHPAINEHILEIFE